MIAFLLTLSLAQSSCPDMKTNIFSFGKQEKKMLEYFTSLCKGLKTNPCLIELYKNEAGEYVAKCGPLQKDL